MKTRKGEVTTTQLVTIIVLIASFVILLLLLFRLDLGQTTDQEICRNSVVLQGQPLPSGPLDCKTSYSVISGETKEEVMQALANEMETCWWMFGEGKINYGKAEIVETQTEYAICSIVEFDEATMGKVGEITYTEFYQYLENTTRKDSGRSYLNYFYGINSVSAFTPEEEFEVDLVADKIITSAKYSIMTGVNNNPSPIDDENLGVYIIPTAEISTRLEENREFITKA